MSSTSPSPTPSTQQPTATVPEAELRIAGPIARLAALAYDSFLIFGLLVVPLFILTGVREHGHGAPLQTDGVVHELPPIAPKPVLLLYIVGVVCGFYYYFWRRNGQTLGMQAWRLRLDSRDGGRASPRQCLIRMPVGLLALLCGGLGFFWLWIDRDRLAWQDRASNTRVVVLPKRGKAGRAAPPTVVAPAADKAAAGKKRRQ
jgi:uncharacterized RDD family membrane protein YckC